jgi:hypothetical protein
MDHGNNTWFDLDLPITGAPGVECRSGGPNGNYEIVFTFTNTLASVGGVSVTNGMVSGSQIGPDSHEYIVDLAGVADVQYATITLNDVLDSENNNGSVSSTMGVLFGDVNGNGNVSGSDVNLCKAQVGTALSVDNFRDDVNANGAISGSDVNLIKAQVGAALPSGQMMRPSSFGSRRSELTDRSR